MRRGELYRVASPSAYDPKKSRVFVVVSRQALIQSQFFTVICAPLYSKHDDLSTQVAVGTEEGLKHASSIHCDELISLPKTYLTSFVGTLPPSKMQELSEALRTALELSE